MAQSFPIRIIDASRCDWSALAERPAGWRVRRVTAGPRTCRYVLYDAVELDVAIWLSAVPPRLADSMRAIGYRPHRDDERVWVRRQACQTSSWRREMPATLPRYVSQVDQEQLTELDAAADWPAYAIGLRRVFSPVSHRVLPGWAEGTASEVLGLADGRLAVLACYGEDPLVEAFWTRRHHLITEVARMSWDLVLTPIFSMYGNYPRTEMLLNFRRNLLLAAEMCASGIPAVPTCTGSVSRTSSGTRPGRPTSPRLR